VERVVVAGVVIVLAVVVAAALERRRPPGPAPPGAYPVPRQVDRSDFDRPDAPWLVVLFSSNTCDSCARVRTELTSLRDSRIVLQEVEHAARGDLHARYGVEAVPMTLVADAEGVVQAAFVGDLTGADVQAALARPRDRGL
jgi:hypothetical protein